MEGNPVSTPARRWNRQLGTLDGWGAWVECNAPGCGLLARPWQITRWVRVNRANGDVEHYCPEHIMEAAK